MDVIVHTRTKKDPLAKQLGFRYASLDDLLANSDIVSLHVPSTKETVGMVNKEFLGKLKEDAVLINTARGNVINDEDLIAHLESHHQFWYGTDVFNNEPAGKGEFKNPLA